MPPIAAVGNHYYFIINRKAAVLSVLYFTLVYICITEVVFNAVWIS